MQKFVTLQFCDFLRNLADGHNRPKKTPTRKKSQ